MTNQEVAEMLDGREYESELTDLEESLLRGESKVVVFGAGAFFIKFRGAIQDDVCAGKGAVFYFDEKRRLANVCREINCPCFAEMKAKPKTIRVPGGPPHDALWTFETKIPHATFDILEYGEKCHEGIVFDLNSLKGDAQ
jgi:hypothetical protein